MAWEARQRPQTHGVPPVDYTLEVWICGDPVFLKPTGAAHDNGFKPRDIAETLQHRHRQFAACSAKVREYISKLRMPRCSVPKWWLKGLELYQSGRRLHQKETSVFSPSSDLAFHPPGPPFVNPGVDSFLGADPLAAGATRKSCRIGSAGAGASAVAGPVAWLHVPPSWE